MALSTANKTRYFQIIGIPLDGQGIIVQQMAHNLPSLSQTYTPTYTVGDFSTLKTLVETKLAALTAEQVTNIDALLTAWECIEASPMRLDGSSTGATGTVIDHPTQRENIRWELGQIIGLNVPQGGFMAAAERMRNLKDPNQPVSHNAGWGANLADR